MLAVVLGASLSWFAAASGGEPTASTLGRAEQEFAELHFEPASELAASVLETEGLPRASLVRATRIRALSLASMGRTSEAASAFRFLLGLDPAFALDSKLGPKLRAPFLEALGFWRSQRFFPSIESSTAAGEGGVVVQVGIRDPLMEVASVQLLFRPAGSMTFFRRSAPQPGGAQETTHSFRLSPDDRIDYYAVALNSKQQVVLEHGSESKPLVVARPSGEVAASGPKVAAEIPVKTSASVQEHSAMGWRFWAGVGLAAIAAGVVTAVLVIPNGGREVGPVLRCGSIAQQCE